MTLNDEQQHALQIVLEGKNIFLTGPGGTGKTYVIHTIQSELEARGKKVAITALTGCAALLLGHHAKTIHSWAGIGLGKDDALKLVAGIRKYGYKAVRRWLTTHVLIIDEISMMTADIFEKLNFVGQSIRKNTKPFGGIQVILVGDFFQLPPVNKDSTPQKFVFESSTWKDVIHKVIALTKIQRQSDPVFHEILAEAREGKLGKKSMEILMKRQGLEWHTQKIKPTLLFSRRAEVDMINDQNLRALKGPERVFEAKTVFDATAMKGLSADSPDVVKAVAKLDRDAPYKQTLSLRVGAQVMLVYNLDQEVGLVNGSRGVVEGFTDTLPSLPLVLFQGHAAPIPVGEQTWESEEIEGVKRAQIPLMIAYAITIHKAQGSTLNCALIDIGPRTFEVGQAYVALSRVKSLDSLYVHELDPLACKAHPKVVEFYKGLASTAPHK
jgi:ATP-dependent DNA helicase PIF1